MGRARRLLPKRTAARDPETPVSVMESPSCDLCGANEFTRLYRGAELPEPAPAEVALVRCERCGLIYLNPRPRPEEIGAFYPPDYMCFRPAVEDERWGLMRRVRGRKLAQRRRRVEHYSLQTPGRVLDVGSSTGLFLHEMQQAGWETTGVEPTPSAAGYARERFGLEVHTCMLAEAPLAPESFDAITFWDVLEHTFSPTAELQRTARLLKPGGVVAINVPNWHSPDRKLFGPFWIGLDPPRHLYVFTRPTLEALVRKAGLEPLAWECFMPSYYSFILSIDRWLSVRAPRLAGPVQRFLNFPGVRFLFEPYFTPANWLRRGGVIALFARKPAAHPSAQ